MKIPATVITGFLGSGKTTMIQYLLENNNGRRFALIVSEFGGVGIDGGLLADYCGAACRPGDIIELADGAHDCAAGGGFPAAVTALLDRPDPPEHLLIEACGLARPRPLIDAFNQPAIKKLASVDAVVTLVDCPAVAEGRFTAGPDPVKGQRAAAAGPDQGSALGDLFEAQVGAADILVLTKTDLVDTATLNRVQAEVQRTAPPGVRMVRASRGRVAPSALLGLRMAAEDNLGTKPVPNDQRAGRPHDRFASIALRPPGFGNLNQVNRVVRNAIEAHGLLRVKGTLRIEGKPMRLVVQAAGPRLETYFDRPWAEGEQPRLVAIGPSGTDWKAACADLGEPVRAAI